MAHQSRRFTLTIFQKEQPVLSELMSFFIGQREVCPKTGKKHYQCYFELEKKKCLKPLIKHLEENFGHHDFHVEIALGTQLQNITYCTKEETQYKRPKSFRLGIPMEQGQRNDLQDIADAIIAGKTDYEILMSNPTWFHHERYIKKLREVRLHNYKTIQREIEVKYIYGDPGSGKSRQVFEEIGDKKYYMPIPPKNGNLWFDGYDGEDILWLEDIDEDSISRTLFLRLLDRYPLTLEVKGGITHACWTKVYITSNFEPEYHCDAIQRRFTTVIELMSPEMEEECASGADDDEHPPFYNVPDEILESWIEPPTSS